MECPECGSKLYFDGKYYNCDTCNLGFRPEDLDESLPVDEAAEIWRSYGEDEDYMFGYTEDELRAAL